MILPTAMTVAVADGETIRLFRNTGVKPGVHLVEITAAPPAPAHSGSGVSCTHNVRLPLSRERNVIAVALSGSTTILPTKSRRTSRHATNAAQR
jgi:hypothetical protein